jgi:hypothetical protein
MWPYFFGSFETPTIAKRRNVRNSRIRLMDWVVVAIVNSPAIF